MEDAECADARDDILHLEKDCDDLGLRQSNRAAKKRRATMRREMKSGPAQFILFRFDYEVMCERLRDWAITFM
jgi:hypothetical protein